MKTKIFLIWYVLIILAVGSFIYTATATTTTLTTPTLGNQCTITQKLLGYDVSGNPICSNDLIGNGTYTNNQIQTLYPYDYNSLQMNSTWRTVALVGSNHGIANVEINPGDLAPPYSDSDILITSHLGYAVNYLFAHEKVAGSKIYYLANSITGYPNGDMSFNFYKNNYGVSYGGFYNGTKNFFINNSGKIEMQSPNGSWYRCGPSDTGIWTCTKV